MLNRAFAPTKTESPAVEIPASQPEPVFPLEMAYELGVLAIHLIPDFSSNNGWDDTVGSNPQTRRTTLFSSFPDVFKRAPWNGDLAPILCGLVCHVI